MVAQSSLAAVLQAYLQHSRGDILIALEGLSEYDSRRALAPSGSNVLGLVKHLIGVEASYLGDCVGRPWPVELPWVLDGSIWQGADMWATADESRLDLVGRYREVWAHSDATLADLPLDAPATVEWWPAERRQTTLGELAVRVVDETARHAGQIDILREGIDGYVASPAAHDSVETQLAYLARIQAAAEAFRP